jgi:excinuclease ABC subunit C
MENAKTAYETKIQAQEKGEGAQIALQKMLHLTRLPNRIEGFDISNIMGQLAVGSMVVFEEGVAKKSDYRRFRMKTVLSGADDFAMMAEVLSRRVAALSEENRDPPDLILIDGGKGQLSAVRAVLERAGLESTDIIGLAKEKNGHPERVYLPDIADPILLPKASPATHLLMRVRDEAHRFAISYHRKIRSQNMLTSKLEQVAGIGKTRRLVLLRHFGTVEKIKEASLEEIQNVPTLYKKIAQQLFDALHPNPA